MHTGRLLPGDVQRDTAGTDDGVEDDEEWANRRAAANEARKRQRRAAKERDGDPPTTPATAGAASSSSLSSAGRSQATTSAGLAVATALERGIAQSNRMTALQFLAQHGTEEQKEAAWKQILDMAGTL